MLDVFQRLGPCRIGMEACAGADDWARGPGRFGHDVRLMPPSCGKPDVRRGKTDQADAEAICEAVTRPSRRFVPVRSVKTQALLMTHVAPQTRLQRNARGVLVRQVTRVANALRAHLGAFGVVAPKGVHDV